MFDNILNQMQNQQAEIKNRMDAAVVEADAENGKLKVSVSGNRKILNISIASELTSDTEALEDLLVITLNRALQKAEILHETEIKSIAKDLLPNFGNLFGK